MASAISLFYAPNDMVTGGFSGIAIIIEKVTSGLIPIWLTNVVLNVPLFLVGFKIIGKKFLMKTLFATLFFSVALYFLDFVPRFETDLTLAAVFGGTLSGIGLGLVFKSKATTGGTDLLASLLNKFLKHVSVSKILFAIDSCIIVLGFFVFGPTKAMYAIIAVFVATKVIDFVLEGLSFAKAVFVISAKTPEISKFILADLNRGVTSLSGKGMYTNTEKDVLLCVVSSKEVFNLKEFIKNIDESAFVIVADVREVLGEGFKKDL